MGAILEDMLPLMRGPQPAAVLRNTSFADGHFERESIVASAGGLLHTWS